MTRRTRRMLVERGTPCGVQEQPVGYRCTREAGHTGLHICRDGEGKRIVSWSSRAEWRGPVLHGVVGPKATHTLCGVRAGTVGNPITYENRLVRCKACLAVISGDRKVAPIRKVRRAPHARK